MNHKLRIKKNNHKSLIINLKSTFGFTLVELLIVIAIIGVLSGVLFANFVGVRQRARDSQRKADLKQIQSALEFYRSDIGSYPTNPASQTISKTCPTNSSLTSGGTTYMQKIPCDPNPPGTGIKKEFKDGNYGYYANSSKTSYCLFTCLENTNDSDPNHVSSVGSCNYGSWCSSNKAYILTNP